VRQNLALVLGLRGRTAEAEQMLRQDLPPELVAQNLPGSAPHRLRPRTWGSVTTSAN
jgi:Flp pilus assembly protein TadD